MEPIDPEAQRDEDAAAKKESPVRRRKPLTRTERFIRLWMITPAQLTQWRGEEEEEVLQTTRLFLMSATFPRASTLLLSRTRSATLFFLLWACSSSFLSYKPETLARDPRSWLVAAVILYLILCIHAAWTNPVKYQCRVETEPGSIAYIVIWNIFNASLPLATFAFIVTDYADPLMLMTSYAAIGMWIDYALGAHPHSAQQVTTPALVAGLVAGYDAGSQASGSGVVYLEWLRDPAESGRAFILSVLLLVILGSLLYLALGARNTWIGIHPYRAVPA
jgi:hypothetical protein